MLGTRRYSDNGTPKAATGAYNYESSFPVLCFQFITVAEINALAMWYNYITYYLSVICDSLGFTYTSLSIQKTESCASLFYSRVTVHIRVSRRSNTFSLIGKRRSYTFSSLSQSRSDRCNVTHGRPHEWVMQLTPSTEFHDVRGHRSRLQLSAY